MKQFILALLVVAVTPLPELFIYDAQTCVLEEHLVADKIQVVPKNQLIRLYSKDNYGWTGEDVLIQERQEFFIKDGKKSLVIRFDGEKVIELQKGNCNEK